jgi:hypothetical protein
VESGCCDRKWLHRFFRYSGRLPSLTEPGRFWGGFDPRDLLQSADASGRDRPDTGFVMTTSRPTIDLPRPNYCLANI